MHVSTIVLVCLPLLGAVAAALLPRASASAVLAAGLVGASAAAAVVLTFLPVTLLPVLDVPERFATVTAGFVAGLSAVVQGFAVRHLRADLRQRWFVGWVNLLTAGSLLVALAPSVLWFGIGWSTTGAALVLLLATYRPVPQARLGVRRTALAFLVGDAALWAAIAAVLAIHGGDVPWSALAASLPATGPAAPLLLALCVVTAGLSRSAQVPFSRWLPATVAASTPVSAIMHAGVVNAATLLVIRFSPALAGAPVAVLVLFCCGAATAVLGAAGMLVIPDLKGRLVASTAAQMGFMVLTLGVGAYAAALFHLICHGWYKAELFLGSSSQIDTLRARSRRPAPGRASAAGRRWGTGAAVAVPAVAILATTAAIGVPTPSALVLAGYGIVTGAVALRPALTGTASPRFRAAAIVATGVAGVVYPLAVHAFDLLVGPGMPAAAAPLPWWALLVPAALFALVSALPAIPGPSAARIYGLLLGATGGGLPRIRAGRRSVVPAPLPLLPTRTLVLKDAE